MKRPSLMVLAAIITLLAVMPLVSDQSDAADTVYAEPGATIGKTVYTTLTDALNHADKGDTVIITGKAGESYYISNDIRIKAGVTLILPYSDNDRTGHSLGESESKTSAKISGDKYIELVVRDRVTVTVEGSFIIGGITGRPAYFDYQGHTSGSYSQVVLGGNLVLKSGGELHCYGFIKGHGKVVANPNSSVYEPLVILDYIGGDNMVNLYEENQAAFNRYAFINIQCTLRVDSGASFYGYTSLYAKDKYQECNVNIINTYDAMFSLEPKAYATFTYDDTKYLEDTWTSNIWKDIGKMTVTIVGGAKFGTISLNVMDNYIDLNDNYFSIPYNFDYFLEDGIYSINAHYRILPGACITIGENAELDVRKELVLFSGLNDREFEEKYYPLTALLKKYGFRTSGSLIVNGTLVISTGSSLAGIIEGNNEKSTIIVEEESEVGVRTIEFGCDHKSGKYGITKTTNNLTTRSMSAQLVSKDGYLFSLEMGCTYKFEKSGKQFVLKDYVQNNGKYTSGQTFIGNWTLYEKGIEYTYLPWENDIDGNVIALKDISTGLGLITSSEKQYLIRVFLDCYGVITLKYDAIKKIVEKKANIYISSNDYHEIFSAEDLSKYTKDMKVNEVTVYAKSVTIIGEEEKCLYMDLSTPDAYRLEAVILPQYTTDKSLKWTSSNTSVSTVDNNGKLHLVGLGETVIRATTVNGRSATCTIMVEIPVESVQILDSPGTISIGAINQTLHALVLPENATVQNVWWTSSNTNILNIDANGRITALREGTVTVTATSERGPFNTVTIDVVTLPKKISFVSPVATVGLGEPVDLEYELTPANAYSVGITWSSSNPSVIAVTENGLEAVGTGETIITVKTSNGFSDSCKVKVTAEVISIGLNCSVLSLQPLSTHTNTTGQLKVSFYPENATDKSIKWESSDSSIANVDKYTGVVTSKNKEGITTITATSSNGVTATCKVVVSKPIEKVTLNPTSLDLSIGDEYVLTVTVLPEIKHETSGYRIIEWTSHNPAIASVDENGKVLALASGTTTIDVTVNGSTTESCIVTVHSHTNEIKLNENNLELELGASYRLKATVYPSDVIDKGVTWSSSNKSIVSVSNGTVKGLSEGTATITVTSKDNGMTATCIVTVIIPVTSVELDHTEITMDVGDTFVLHATVLPENAKDKSVTWSVSNKKIAYVEDGMITALSPGETTVTVTTGYKGYTATCTVKTIQHAEGVTIRNAPESIELDNSLQLIASVYPEDASNKKVTWSVDNKEVLSVRNGLITGLSLGVATVTVKTVDGGYTASCTISVNEPIVRIHIDKPTILLPDIGSTAILEATHTPQSIPVDLSWKSDRPAVVKVDNGMLTAVSPGIATITVTDSLSGQRATCVVTVECLAKDISLDYSKMELELNRSLKLNATVSPELTTDKTVKWSSDNESIAKVDQDGNVTSYGTGTVTITATTSNGLVSECTIEIFGHVTGIELDKESIVFPDLMERDALIATVIHDRAKDTSVIWTSSNEDVAIVDGKGSVTSIGKGTATITAKTTDGGYTAECEIAVNAKVKTVVLNNDSLTLGIGERFQLIATVGPDYANNKNVTWSSKDQSIVTVNESGIISAESKGTTVITVTTEDGGLTAACIVTVVTRVSGITLDISDPTISDIGDSYTLVPTIEPEDADDKDIIWTSDNKDIAVVDEYGTVTGMSIGTTSITVTTADGGFYATCIVTVEGKVKTITLDRSELTMESEEVAQLTAEVYPELATKNLVWFSSDDSIATVDDNGRITSFDNGNVVIICKDVYTGIYADCEITVYTHVNTVEIDEILETVYAGDSLTLTVTIGPEKAVDRTVSWQVDNEDIATIDSNGCLTVKNAGIFTVKATTNDGGYVGMLRVETFSRIASITLEEFLILYETQSLEVKYSVDPMDSPESLIWSVDNDKVISFKDGKLTALSVGDATLTATSESGNVQAECKITVNERESFVLDTVDIDGNTVRIKHIEKDMELIKNTEWTDLRPVIPVTMTCTGTIVLKADVVRMLIDYDTIIDVTSTDYHIALKPEMVTSVNEDVILNKEYATIVIGNTATSEDAKKLLDELMDSITSKDVTPVLKLRFNDTINEFILNKEFMETISSKEVDIMVSNGIYSVTLSSDTIGILEGDVKLGMKNTPADEMNSYQKKTIGDRYAISINLSANDVPYHSLGGKSTVSFPYTLAEGEDPSMIQIWYVDETSAHSYPATYQDGMVTFETDHFSCYVVAFEDPPKQDLNIDDGTNIILVIVALVIVLFVVATVSMALKRMKRHNRN